jgi:hypothetical protein
MLWWNEAGSSDNCWERLWVASRIYTVYRAGSTCEGSLFCRPDYLCNRRNGHQGRSGSQNWGGWRWASEIEANKRCFIYIFTWISAPLPEFKDKLHPRTGHDGPEGEQRYCSTLSLTLSLDWVDGQRYTTAALTPGMIRYLLRRRLGGP